MQRRSFFTTCLGLLGVGLTKTPPVNCGEMSDIEYFKHKLTTPISYHNIRLMEDADKIYYIKRTRSILKESGWFPKNWVFTPL